MGPTFKTNHAPSYRLWIADNLAFDGKYSEAVGAYESCVSAANYRAEVTHLADVTNTAYLNRAHAARHAGDLTNAVAFFLEAHQCAPEESNALLEAACIAEKIEDFSTAEKFYRQIANTEASSHADDPREIARRNLLGLSSPDALFEPNPFTLADKLATALLRKDITTLRRLISSTHFAVGAIGGHLNFETDDLLEALFLAVADGNVSCDSRLLGAGKKRYLPTFGWQSLWYQGQVLLIISEAPRGWQWTGVALAMPTANWADRSKPTKLGTNSPLPFEVQAPWPNGECFTAGGFYPFLAESAELAYLASLLYGFVYVPVALLTLSSGCCGWGTRGFYYNDRKHTEDHFNQSFAIDFTRYQRFLPFVNATYGTPVLAVRDGMVGKVVSGHSTGDSNRANSVEIKHADPANPSDTRRYTSKYLHLDGPFKIPVSENMKVRVGTRLGLMDDTGDSLLHHLHFSMHDRQLLHPDPKQYPEGKSVRPTPMSGYTLEDGDSNTCVTSTNVEYTGTNEMIELKQFAVQNFTITPVALALNEKQLPDLRNQRWHLVLSGVVLCDLQGNSGQFLRETMLFKPDLKAAMQYALDRQGYPRPPGLTEGLSFVTRFQVEQWAPLATLSAFSNTDHAVNSGYAVDAWRPNPFVTITDAITAETHNNIFDGLQVDVAVSDVDGKLHRLSYSITLIGRIQFGAHFGPR
jgi:hypothetical protein